MTDPAEPFADEELELVAETTEATAGLNALRKPPIRVAVAEGMAVLREALVSALELQSDLIVVGSAARGDEALSLVERTRPDVLLTGLRLDGVDGFELARHPRIAAARTRVLVLSSYSQPGLVRRAVEAGVCGFIPKEQPLSAVVAAVHKVHEGQSVFASKLLNEAMTQGNNPLTPRESDVLRLLAAGNSVGSIAQRLSLAPGTVRNRLTRVKRKLSARTAIDAVRIAREHGWL